MTDLKASLAELMRLHAAVLDNEPWSNDKFADAAIALLPALAQELERLSAPKQHVWRDYGPCGSSCVNCGVDKEDERTAARQEGYNAHLMQLARHAQPTEDEREHCEHVCDEIVDALPINSETITDTQGCAVTDIIIRERSKLLAERDDFLRLFRESESERAAVRAEAAQAAASLRDAYEAKLLQAESNERCVRSALAVTQKYLNESTDELTAANAALERLQARVRELEQGR